MKSVRHIFSKHFYIACADVLTIFFLSIGFGSLFLGSLGMTLQGSSFEHHILFLGSILSSTIFFLIRGFLYGKIEIPKTALDAPLLLLLLLYGVSSFLSDDIWHSFWGFFGDPGRGTLALFSFVLMYYLTVHLIRIDRIRWMIVMGIGGVCFLICSLFLWDLYPSVFHSLSFEKKEEMFHLPSTVILLLSFLPIIFGFFQERMIYEKRNKGVVFIQAFFVFLCSFSVFFFTSGYFPDMSFWWSFSMMGVWFFLTVAILIWKGLKCIWLPLAVFFLCIFGYFLGKIFFDDTRQDVVRISFRDSFEITRNSFVENPFFGVGPSLYGSAFSLHKPLDLNQTSLVLARPSQAEGMIFEVPVMTGISGSLAFSFLILYAIGLSFFAGYQGKEKGIFLWIGSVVSLFFLSSVILFFPSSYSVLVLWFFVIALAVSLRKSQEEIHSSVRVISTRPKTEYALSAAFSVLVLFVFYGYSYVFLAKASLADFWAKKAIDASSYHEAINYLKRAVLMNPYESRYHIFLAQKYVLVVQSIEKGTEDAESLKFLEENMNAASEHAVRSKNMTPKDVTAWEILGQTYESLSTYMDDYLSVAIESYSEAIALEPHNPRLYVKRGELFLRQASTKEGSEQKEKHFSDAKKDIESALSKKQEFPQAWYLLSLTQEGLGETQGAIESISKGLTYVPEDSLFIQILARLYHGRNQDGDRDRAVKLYKKVIEKDEKGFYPYFSLGRIYAENASYNDALTYYNLALDRVPLEDEETRNFLEKERNQMLQSMNASQMTSSQSMEVQNTPESEVVSSENAINTGQYSDEAQRSSNELRKESTPEDALGDAYKEEIQEPISTQESTEEEQGFFDLPDETKEN